MVKQVQACGWKASDAMVEKNFQNGNRYQHSFADWFGWAGSTQAASHLYRCFHPESVKDVVLGSRHWLPRGSGFSYGDAALSPGGSLIQPEFPARLKISTDSTHVRVPASLPLKELLAQLSLKGFTLPVVPGVLGVSVGGMIAADVHGKNHWKSGSFGRSVEAMKLVLPNGEALWCSRDQFSEIFQGTIGGMGLTGIILEVDLMVVPRCQEIAEVSVRATRDLDETLNRLEETCLDADHASAWVDLSRLSRKPGRGVVIGGKLRSIEAGDSATELWQPESGPSIPPFPSPGEGIIHMHNQVYHRMASFLPQNRLWPLQKMLFPLEGWRDWKQIYGKRGFFQHQCLIPEEVLSEGVGALFKVVMQFENSPTLVVLKKLGAGHGGLSFPEPGITVSMDFRNQQGVPELMHSLNSLVADWGGRVYLAKDSTLTPELLEKMYPDLNEFMKLRDQVDPERKIRSELSSRLGL